MGAGQPRGAALQFLASDDAPPSVEAAPATATSSAALQQLFRIGSSQDVLET